MTSELALSSLSSRPAKPILNNDLRRIRRWCWTRHYHLHHLHAVPKSHKRLCGSGESNPRGVYIITNDLICSNSFGWRSAARALGESALSSSGNPPCEHCRSWRARGGPVESGSSTHQRRHSPSRCSCGDDYRVFRVAIRANVDDRVWDLSLPNCQHCDF